MYTHIVVLSPVILDKLVILSGKRNCFSPLQIYMISRVGVYNFKYLRPVAMGFLMNLTALSLKCLQSNLVKNNNVDK